MLFHRQGLSVYCGADTLTGILYTSVQNNGSSTINNTGIWILFCFNLMPFPTFTIICDVISAVGVLSGFPPLKPQQMLQEKVYTSVNNQTRHTKLNRSFKHKGRHWRKRVFRSSLVPVASEARREWCPGGSDVCGQTTGKWGVGLQTTGYNTFLPNAAEAQVSPIIMIRRMTRYLVEYKWYQYYYPTSLRSIAG